MISKSALGPIWDPLVETLISLISNRTEDADSFCLEPQLEGYEVPPTVFLYSLGDEGFQAGINGGIRRSSTSAIDDTLLEYMGWARDERFLTESDIEEVSYNQVSPKPDLESILGDDFAASEGDVITSETSITLSGPDDGIDEVDEDLYVEPGFLRNFDPTTPIRDVAESLVSSLVVLGLFTSNTPFRISQGQVNVKRISLDKLLPLGDPVSDETQAFNLAAIDNVAYLASSEKPKRIATVVHEHQTDKAGLPYIDHPRRVAENVTSLAYRLGLSEKERQDCEDAAWLHDVVEDSGEYFHRQITVLDLLAWGISQQVAAAVTLLTRTSSVPPDEYYRNLSSNWIARLVKICDVADNSNRQRRVWLQNVGVKPDVKRYEKAREMLDLNDIENEWFEMRIDSTCEHYGLDEEDRLGFLTDGHYLYATSGIWGNWRFNSGTLRWDFDWDLGEMLIKMDFSLSSIENWQARFVSPEAFPMRIGRTAEEARNDPSLNWNYLHNKER